MDPAQVIEAGAMSQQNIVNEVTARGDSDVQRFYNNLVIFITGGSGFIGKQLIEKLFRSCRISKLFILLRPKKRKNIHSRLNDILNDPVFDVLRKVQPDFGDRIVGVEGDVQAIRLGINNTDWETLIEEVNVIFHVAATIRFDETLKTATLINVRGVREALILGKTCKNLRSYVHVSTAYVHATTDSFGQEIREELNKAVIEPEVLINMVENMDSDRLIDMTKGLIKGWPNTYSFTKSISEELIRNISDGLPICIVRPGIIMGTYHEPFPGWLDRSCINGAIGIMYGLIMGIIHAVKADKNMKFGIVPCDYVNNAIIVAGKENANHQAKGGMDTKIYTVASTQKNPITSGLLEEEWRRMALVVPSPKAVYYSYGFSTKNNWIFMISSLFLHTIPGYLADLVCILMGKPKRFVKLFNKVFKMSNVLSYFMTNEWDIKDDNLSLLYKNLSREDKIIFNCDVTNIDWSEYIQVTWIGIRKYIIKDELKNSAYAVKKQRYFQIAHYCTSTLYLYGMWKLLRFVFSIVRLHTE